MFKIGDFSQLSQVSVKTLRYYDQLGLLKPAHVDHFTGYRYYAADQLPRLNRILALKDLGFALEQIAPLLDETVPLAELRGMLRLRQAEVQQHITAETARLARIDARLKQMEQEEQAPAYDVVVKHIEAQPVIGIRDVIEKYSAATRLFDELEAYLSQTHLEARAWIAVWHTVEYRETDIDVEATVVVDGSPPPTSRVQVHDLPPITAACVVHHGSLSTLGQAYNALLYWLDANGAHLAGPARDVYHNAESDQNDPSYVTEVQLPIQEGI